MKNLKKYIAWRQTKLIPEEFMVQSFNFKRVSTILQKFDLFTNFLRCHEIFKTRNFEFFSKVKISQMKKFFIYSNSWKILEHDFSRVWVYNEFFHLRDFDFRKKLKILCFENFVISQKVRKEIKLLQNSFNSFK